MSLQFTTLTESTTIDDIKESYIFGIHSQYYNMILASNDTCNDVCNNIDNSIMEILVCEKFKFCTLKNDTCISDCLRTGILFEKFLLAFIQQYVPNNKDMLDIGANIGVWSIVYSKYLLNNTIYAFEPQPQIFKCLENNIILNGCKNVKAFNVGLSDEDKVYHMNARYNTQQNFGAFRIIDDNEKESKLLEIKCQIGDTLDLTLDFNNIGFIKMDVEGFEYKVLLGLENTICNNKPVLLIEIHKTDSKKNETFKKLYEFGYRKVIKLTHCDYFFTH